MTLDIFNRHKAGFWLFAYVLFSIICLTNRVDPYVKALKTSLWFLAEPQIVYTGQFFNRLDSFRNRLFGLTRAEGENYVLREQNRKLAAKELELFATREENERLRGLLDLRIRHFSDGIAAEVVGRDLRDWFYSVTVDQGSDDGVQLAAAVMGGTVDRPALVGRVVEVDKSSSKVLLITDPVSAVSVSVGKENHIGLLEGQNRPTLLARYLSNRARFSVGDEAKTVGLGGVFPPGVPVGVVSRVTETIDGFFQEAEIAPYVEFGSLQEVLILRRELAVPEVWAKQ